MSKIKKLMGQAIAEIAQTQGMSPEEARKFANDCRKEQRRLLAQKRFDHANR